MNGGKVRRWAGWVLSGLLVVMFLMGGSANVAGSEQTVKAGEHVGWSPDLAPLLGTLLITSAVVYAIPPTAVFGAILLTGYFGAGGAAHIRVGDGPDKYVLPFTFGALAWVALALRDPRVFWLAFARR